MKVECTVGQLIVARAIEFTLRHGHRPTHLYAPEGVVDALEDQCIDLVCANGTPFTQAVNAELTHIGGMEIHTLPPGDHRIVVTDEPL